MVIFGAAFLVSLLLIPLIRRLSFSSGRVVQPRQDRWNRRSVPVFGGVGIFAAFTVGLLLAVKTGGGMSRLADPGAIYPWGFLTGAVLMFALGLWDDLRPLSPSTKLIWQIAAATLVIFLGYQSAFFSPKIENAVVAQIPNILLTYLWLVGITNAINLLDNMDGLAGGMSLIASVVLGYFFWRDGDELLLAVALALGGALAGFLIHNFPPAKIFMGDSGSLFLGFLLATLAVTHSRQQASNVLAALGVPTLVFLLPILDTGLVTITRLLRGQSPVQGGKDHTSHRLIAFGLSERQTLVVLYTASLIAAFTAAAIESMSYWLSLAIAPMVMVGLALFAAYLGKIKVVAETRPSRQGQALARIFEDLTYRRRIFEVILDFILIGLTYYLSFLARFGLGMNSGHLDIYLQTLPLALAAGMPAFLSAGVYRGIWSYMDIDDLLRFFQAALSAAAVTAGLIFIISATDLAAWGDDFPRLILIYFGLFLFAGLTASRLSFRLLDRLREHNRSGNEQRVLIYGAGDTGELSLRWIRSDPRHAYRVVGFIDDDPLRQGRRIHGIMILGGGDRLEEFIRARQIAGVILAWDDQKAIPFEAIIERSRALSCWVRRFQAGFLPDDPSDGPIG